MTPLVIVLIRIVFLPTSPFLFAFHSRPNKATEGSGRGLLPPSVNYPILQTYIDVCLSGCLEHGEEFAREFIATTFLWDAHWLNERTLARRPWLHQKQYVKIDKLLQEAVPAYYERRRLESEYATLLTEGDT